MQPGYLYLGSFAKVTARNENCVTVDPGRLDANGIPIPVVRFRFSDNDHALWKANQQSILEMLVPPARQIFCECRRKTRRLCQP